MAKRKRGRIGEDGEIIYDKFDDESWLTSSRATVIAAIIGAAALLASVVIQTPNAAGVPQPVIVVVLQTVFSRQDVPAPTRGAILQVVTATPTATDIHTPDIRSTVLAEFTQTALAQPSETLTSTITPTSTLIPTATATNTSTFTPTPQTQGLPFADNFSDNRNGWIIAADSSGAASLANGMLRIVARPNRRLPFQVEIPGVRASQFLVDAEATTSYNAQSRTCDSFQYFGYALGDPQVEQYIFVAGLQWTQAFGLTNECAGRKWYAKVFQVKEGQVEFFKIVDDREDYLSTPLSSFELAQDPFGGSSVPFKFGFERDYNNLVSLYANGTRLISYTIAPTATDNRISLVAWAPRTFQNQQFQTDASIAIDNMSVQ